MRKNWLDNLRWFTVLLVPSTIGLLVFQWTTGYFNVNCGAAPPDLSQVPAIIRWLIYIALSVAVFSLTPLLYEILRRIPLLRWAILGEKRTGYGCPTKSW